MNCADVALNLNCMFEFTNHHTDAQSLFEKIVSYSYRTQAGFESLFTRTRQCRKSARSPADTFVWCAVDRSGVRWHLKRTVLACTAKAIFQSHPSTIFISETSFRHLRLGIWDPPTPLNWSPLNIQRECIGTSSVVARKT